MEDGSGLEKGNDLTRAYRQLLHPGENLPNKETEGHVHLILLRGMEDLPDKLSGVIASFLGADSFNSNWFDKSETFEAKLQRLNLEVKKAKDMGEEVIFIGVSAGGGLALSYMLKYPENQIRHVYSLSGVLSPDKKYPEIQHLSGESESFKKMTDYLAEHLTPEAIAKQHLANKVSAYSSARDKDRTVPYEVEQPPWIKRSNKIIIGNDKNSPDHRFAILRTLIYDIRKQLQQVRNARFD